MRGKQQSSPPLKQTLKKDPPATVNEESNRQFRMESQELQMYRMKQLLTQILPSSAVTSLSKPHCGALTDP